MIPLMGAVLVASLLGSLHCAGMCGAFVAFAVASDESASPRRWRLNAAYNIGRLVTYCLLGAVAGTIGAAVDLGGAAVGVRDGAAMLAGGVMVVFGVVTVLRLNGVRIARLPLPAALSKFVAAGHRVAMQWTPVRRALAIGLLTTLLPCGWLYAFAVTAAGTANPAYGAATMAVFWLGTLPVMAALGAGLQSLAGPLRRKVPMATALLLVAVGVFTIIGRFQVPSLAGRVQEAQLVVDDRPIGLPTGTTQQELPCCNGN